MAAAVDAALRRIVGAGLGGGAYVVGGALRDRLLGVEPREADLIAAGAEAWAARVGAEHGVRAARIMRRPAVWRLRLKDAALDVAELEGDLSADLGRRDFTVNAMALPLSKWSADFEDCLIDPLGGRGDLAAGRLRLVSAGALAADPLRALRGIRLEATHGLRMTPQTDDALRRSADSLHTVAPERIWEELERIFLHTRSASALRRMDELGVLDVIAPELAACRGVDQRPVHRRDVLGHQLDALAWLDELVAPQPPQDALAAQLWDGLWRSGALPEPEQLRKRLWEGRLTLRAAALLHDLGKPATRTVEADGRTRFLGHSELGAELAASRLTALRAPRAVVEAVRVLVRHHLRPGQIAAPGRAPSGRALHRFHAALGELAAPLCWLFLADSLATVGGAALAPRWPAYAAHAARIAAWQPRQASGDAPLLDGHGIMEATGLRAGPAIGVIRAAVAEAAALGEVETVEQARALARRLANSEGVGAGIRLNRGEEPAID